jgi:threonine synthase
VIKKNLAHGFEKGDTIVCTLTGHGLKDPDAAMSVSPKPMTVPAEIGDVVSALGYG